MMMRYAAAAAAAITAFGMLAMATMATGDCGVLGTYECVSEAIKYETLGDDELGFIPVAGKSLTSFDMVTEETMRASVFIPSSGYLDDGNPDSDVFATNYGNFSDSALCVRYGRSAVCYHVDQATIRHMTFNDDCTTLTGVASEFTVDEQLHETDPDAENHFGVRSLLSTRPPERIE